MIKGYLDGAFILYVLNDMITTIVITFMTEGDMP